jgi:hypothetical protein
MSKDFDDDQRWVDDGLERREVESEGVWPAGYEDDEVPFPFIGPVLPHLCEACGGAIYRFHQPSVMDGMWRHVELLPVELGHTAVPEPF